MWLLLCVLFVEGTGTGSPESAAADDHDNDDTGCELPIDIGKIYTKSETASEFCKANAHIEFC